MRISDLSSDVGSSDLLTGRLAPFSRSAVHPQDEGIRDDFRAFDEMRLEQHRETRLRLGVEAPFLAFGILDRQAAAADVQQQIGRACVGKECVSTCRSRWSLYH